MVSVTRQTGTRSPAVSSLLVTSVILSTLLGSSITRAQEDELPASDALPGIYRVGVARTAPAAIAGTLGYGFTEAQNTDDGAHHRLSLRAAAAMPVVNWLSVGAVVDGRYDKHPDDSGGIADTALQARASTALGNWQLGAGVLGRLPGAESFGAMARSASVEGQALLSTTVGRVRFASLGGYRFNNGGAAGSDPARLSSGDRLALGLSEFDAVLLGLGAGIRVGKNELLGEVSADVLVGSDAPPLSQSPLRVAAGVRRAVARGLSLELLAVGSLSAQPNLAADAPLVPNEPRLGVFASIRYQFLPQPAPPPAKPIPPPAPPLQPLSSRLEVTVNDDQGAPVTNPTVFVTAAGERRTLDCNTSGQCSLEDAPIGELVVHVEAPECEPAKRPVTIQAGAPTQLEVRLVAVPPPSQLRGVIRSLDGKAITVRVRVEPVGTDAVVDDKGSFQLDLPPGSYDVVIEASDYVTQHRRVQVEPKGVVVLNVDLARKR
ncbi:MAG TPA: carboxypeptidase-like regulatory domain-containing protein [Polyangiaceae bacterium]|nr:carboxypeptidase-like regulatory domain-containing protein [Polyangiaceae bacterium]